MGNGAHAEQTSARAGIATRPGCAKGRPMITVASLVAAGIGPTQARAFEAPLNAACERFQINTPQRRAAFVAQCAHESGLFVHLEEGLFYRSADRIGAIFKSRVPNVTAAQALVGNPKGLANRVDAGRNGNGNE